MGWLGRQKVKHSSLGLHKTSTKCDDNQKTTLKWCWKMNAHAHFLICFHENDLLLSLIAALKVGWKFEQLEVKGHEPT
jgi:hypothetical protein